MDEALRTMINEFQLKRSTSFDFKERRFTG
jgi:hypothetical protein